MLVPRFCPKLAAISLATVVSIDPGMNMPARKEWVHLRRSNTEPIIRIYAEAATKEAADALAQQIIDIAKKIIG